MMKKIAICVLVLIVALLLIGCGKDEIENENVYVEPYFYTASYGEIIDDIAGTFYQRNTVYVDWAVYRQKIYDLNYHIMQNGRCLQENDIVVIYTIHKNKKGKAK